MRALPRHRPPGVIVGYDNSDDAGVFQLTTDIAVVQTVDYFPPIVDEPYIYGQIAAVNALSDIYAMGGEPKTALSIAAFPGKAIDRNVLTEIMRGGLDQLTEAGVALLGGHSVRDDEIKFGYAITGTIEITNIKQNSGAQAGDRVLLTKPLGTGLITTALKHGKAKSEHINGAIAAMLQLNRRASEICSKYRVHAVTDVTGFGFIGHASEVAKASRVCICVDHSTLPFLPGALEYSRAGFCAGGLTSNEEFFGPRVSVSNAVVKEVRNLLFDPQTSGGLLIFCHPDDADSLLSEMQDENIAATEIGYTSMQAEHLLTVV